MSLTVGLDFSQYPTIAAAFRSRAFIRMVIGPAGSAKTSNMFNFFLMKALEQAPAEDGTRYTRAVIIRNTYDMLQRSTLKTAENMLGAIGTFVQSKPPRGLVTLPLEDGTKVRLELEFLALDTEEGLNRLLGNEMTWIGVDEVSEIPETVIERAVTRIGRYPSGRYGRVTDCGLFGTTNGPKMNHWLYQWYLGGKSQLFRGLTEKLGRPYFELFKQPAGLLRPADPRDKDKVEKWLPNPKAENIQNLEGGYNYYYQMLSQSEEGRKAYIEGDFAPLKSGEVVFPEFSNALHVIPDGSFFLQDGMSLGLSFDFGRTPVCHLWVTLPNGRMVVIEEFMMKNASVEDLMKSQVMPALQTKYSRHPIDWGTGDPAGLTGGQGIGTSPYEVLMGAPYNIPMECPPVSNRIDPRLDSLRGCLTRLIGGGVPMFGILESCRFTIAALGQTYIYEKKRGVDGVKEEPTKSHENWVSDLADSICYGTLYRLLRGRSKKTFKRPPKRKRLA